MSATMTKSLVLSMDCPREKLLKRLEIYSRLGATILEGPPGTGKTTLVADLADQLGVPLYVIHSHPDMMAGEMLLSYAPTASGLWVQVYKPGLQAWGYGGKETAGVLLVDDAQLMGPGGMAALFCLMDGARGSSMTLDDGTTITPKPGYRIILTMNGDHRTLDEPIVDRLWGSFRVMVPSDAMFKRLTAGIEALARQDYNGEERNPALTFREWLAISEGYQALSCSTEGLTDGEALHAACSATLCDESRVKAILVTMATAGAVTGVTIPGAAEAVAGLAASLPSGAPR